MRYVCSKLRENSGFSLIELMVVVAILGVLATIAIPNFQRFQARARQKSGQALLSAYYTAAKAVHAEYTHYYGDFPSIGFRPAGELVYHLQSTIQVPPPPVGVGPGGVVRDLACTNTYIICGTLGYQLGVDFTAGPTAHGGMPASVMTRNTFLVYVAADLNGVIWDRWTIDHNKNFVNVDNGLP